MRKKIVSPGHRRQMAKEVASVPSFAAYAARALLHVIEDFPHRYNQLRPHNKLGYQSPVRYAQPLTPSPAPVGLRPPYAGDGTNPNQ